MLSFNRDFLSLLCNLKSFSSSEDVVCLLQGHHFCEKKITRLLQKQKQNKNLQDCKLRLNIAEATSFISFDTTIASPLNDHVMLLLK